MARPLSRDEGRASHVRGASKGAPRSAERGPAGRSRPKAGHLPRPYTTAHCPLPTRSLHLAAVNALQVEMFAEQVAGRAELPEEFAVEALRHVVVAQRD